LLKQLHVTYVRSISPVAPYTFVDKFTPIRLTR